MTRATAFGTALHHGKSRFAPRPKMVPPSAFGAFPQLGLPLALLLVLPSPAHPSSRRGFLSRWSTTTSTGTTSPLPSLRDVGAPRHHPHHPLLGVGSPCHRNSSKQGRALPTRGEFTRKDVSARPWKPGIWPGFRLLPCRHPPSSSPLAIPLSS